MAKRYSGKAVITVTYEDRGDYKASVAIGKRNVWSGRIGAPAAGFGRGIAYDSPKAYDSTAHAALSFADDDTDGEINGEAAYDIDGSGWHVGRSAATRYPKPRAVGVARHGRAKVANPGRRAKPKRKSNGQFAKVARAKRVKARRKGGR